MLKRLLEYLRGFADGGPTLWHAIGLPTADGGRTDVMFVRTPGSKLVTPFGVRNFRLLTAEDQNRIRDNFVQLSYTLSDVA